MGHKRTPLDSPAEGKYAASSPWGPGQREALASYVTTLVRALKLSDWEITVNFDAPTAEESYAEIRPHVFQKRAEIRFGVNFHDLDPDGVRQTLVHELLHCHMFGPHHLADEMLTAAAGAKKAALGLVAMDAQIEQTTDDLANAFAPLLPLPPQPASPRPQPDYVLLDGVTFVGIAKVSPLQAGSARASRSARTSRSAGSLS